MPRRISRRSFIATALALGATPLPFLRSRYAEGDDGAIYEYTRVKDFGDGSLVMMTAIIDHRLIHPEEALDWLLPGSAAPTGPGASAAFKLWTKWDTADQPIPLRYNPASAPPGVDGAFAAQFGADSWNAVPGQAFRFTYKGLTAALPGACDGPNRTSDGGVTLAWKADMPSGVLGTTCALQQGTTNLAGVPRVREADVLFASQAPWSSASPTPGSQYDFVSTCLHELGHVLGLDHTAAANAVMLPSLKPGTQRRAVTSDDTEAVVALYGDGSPIPPAIDRSGLPRKVAAPGVARE